MSTFRHMLRMAAGWTMLVLGIVGLFLPFLQGLLFLTIGVLLLAPYIRIFRKVADWIHHRFPRMRATLKHFGHHVHEDGHSRPNLPGG